MLGANTEIYAMAAATPGGLGASSSVTINGQAVATAYGYAKDVTNLEYVMDLSPANDFTSSATTIEMANATTPSTCVVTYGAATATTTPTYTPNYNGC